jgi:translocation and assembly module TamB
MTWRRIVRRTGRIVLQLSAAVLVLSVIAALGAFVVVQSGWFHEYVRARIIGEIERATGARVELGRFSFRGATLTAQVAPLVLHGKEAEDEPPLLRVESVALQLRVVSILEKKVDLASLRLQKPRIRIVTYPDGSTNLPSPAERLDRRNWAEQLIDIGIERYELTDGVFDYDDREAPLNAIGEDLQLRMRYDATAPAYRVELDSARLRIMPSEIAPVAVGISARFSIERSRIDLSDLRLFTKDLRAELTGELRNLQEPRGLFRLKATAPMRELVNTFALPLKPTGSAAFDGRAELAFGERFTFGVSGRLNARGIGYSNGRINVDEATGGGDLHVGPDEVALTRIDASTAGAHFAGSASLQHWSAVRIEGTLDGVSIAQAANILANRTVPWNGTLSGDVALSATLGRNDARTKVNLAISPVGRNPITGRITGTYDQAGGTISLDSSYAATTETRLEVSGTLDKAIQVQLRSTDLNDILPALAMADPQWARRQIPLKLSNGVVNASGTVTGAVQNPRFQGQVTGSNGIVEGHPFERFSATLNATPDSIAASKFNLGRGALELSGNASIAARNGSFDDAAISSQATIRNANLQELTKEFGAGIEVAGTGSATVQLSGSIRTPQAEVVLDAQKPAAFGEQLDRLRAKIHITPDSIEAANGDASAGPARLRFSGVYHPAGADWKSGDVQLQVAAQDLAFARVAAFRKLAPRLDARIAADLRTRGRISNQKFVPLSADGNVSAQNVTIDKQPVADISLTGNTAGTTVNVALGGRIRDVPFQGQGQWRLEGDEPGTAEIHFNRIALDSVHSLAMLFGATPGGDQAELPFQGFVEGHATLSVALLRAENFQGEITLDAVQLNPRPNQTLQLGVQPQDLVIRNTQPVLIAVNSQEARIRSAQLVARDTNIDVTGGIPFVPGASADLAVRGSVNLIGLQLFNPNLLARGNATVEAYVRGNLINPLLNGRMELKGASLYLNDLPNGVDNANGVVLFDRNRATIEHLTAATGGGTVSFSGFLGFGQELIYRLQADVKQVRVRWPDALSNTFSALLALNGTSNASTLSGTLTIDRTAINPQADFGQMLAMATRSSPSGSDNEYLRGLQFNIHVESAPTFEFDTSLAHNIEASVDLRLRGTPARPVLLGTVDVDEGDIEVFGNKYTLDRGEIRFVNPFKLEPSLDVQLETKARGIAVTVGFTGTPQRLNVSYSSDPPLQQSEIIALLAVGRDPTALGALSSAQATGGSSGFAVAGGGMLSQALSDQLSNRFQRFFGASKVKIDPTLTGVDNLPQARLTLEQQVSKDVTFTYITNLNRTEEQIVRLEWNFDKNWSAVLVRDANGLFGVDVQYKKRLR